MRVLGLTGGVGMGKSACADLARQRGVAIIDTDVLAHQIVEPGQPALDDIRQAFGAEILTPEGRLRRDELARRVFTDPEARLRLEQILHPRIRALWRAQVETWRAAGRAIAMVVIPLLFETNAQTELDATICVACSSATQRARVAARGWSAEQLAQRVAAQWPIEKKIEQSNFVIWSEGSLELHAAQLTRILARYSELSSPASVC